MALAGGRTMGGKVGRTGKGDCGGKVRRPGRKGKDKRRDRRKERVMGRLGDGRGKYKRVAEPREAGWCQWEERERAPVAMTAPTGGGTGGCRWKAVAARAGGTRI